MSLAVVQKPSFLSDQSNELQFAERLMWIFIHLCQKMLLASASDQQKQTVDFNLVLLLKMNYKALKSNPLHFTCTS